MTRSLTVNHAESVAKAKGSSAETIRGGMSAVDLREDAVPEQRIEEIEVFAFEDLPGRADEQEVDDGRHDERDRDDAHEKQDLVQFVEQVARNAYP